jgi:type I restriction enzyme, S subunit
MNPDQLLKYFDRISEASDAISRLRRFILDLAVRGKLVAQDPNDEPATELLKRIQSKKEQLVKSGEIKREKALPPLEFDELPYEISKGWMWARIRQITSDRGQKVPNQDFTYIDVTAINKEAGHVAEAKIVTAADAPSRARKLVRTGDVLYSCVRPYLLNIAVIESDIYPEPIASTAFAVLNGFGLVQSRYLWIVLRSPFMVECVEAKMRGQAYPAINDSDFALLPFPLPPLAEQHHIVAKVDELMTLCDRLEAAKAEREKNRDRLVSVSLQRLNQPSDNKDIFRDDARFIFDNLRRFTTRPAHIKQLRQSILNLAVRGKLVPQDPNDEPAAELLKRIQEYKKQIVHKGGLSAQKTRLDSDNSFASFNLPNGWQWTSMGIVLISSFYGPRFSIEEYCQTGVPTIRTTDMTADGSIVLRDPPKVNVSPERLDEVRCEKYDLLVTRTGSIGTMAVFNADFLAIPSAYIIRLRFSFHTCVRYIYTVLKSTYGQDILGLNTTKLAQPNVNAKNLAAILIPLPPLSEQHRIVAKVDELMTICDKLESQLTITEADNRRLLEAVLHEALSPALAEV